MVLCNVPVYPFAINIKRSIKKKKKVPQCFWKNWPEMKEEKTSWHFLPLLEMEICDFMSFCSVEKRESSKTMTSVTFTESNVTVSSRFWPGAALSSYSQGVFVCRPWSDKGERRIKWSIQNRREGFGRMYSNCAKRHICLRGEDA